MNESQEQALWARIGKMSTFLDEQSEALAIARNTIQKVDEYLNDKELREDFLEWADKKAKETEIPVERDDPVPPSEKQ